MNAFFLALERASAFGLAALVVALGAQVALDGRVPASWRVWIWRVALLQTALALVPLAPLRLAVLPPHASLARPLQEQRNVPPSRPKWDERPPTPPLSVHSSAPSPHTSPASPSVAAKVEAATPRPRVSARVATVRPQQPFTPWPFVLGFYALGWGVQLVALARSFGRVRRLLRACTAVENAAIELELREIAQRMRVATLPPLLHSEGGAPFLVGAIRPVIVVPRALVAPQNRDLEAVLCHELAHLKRRDLAWNAPLWLIQTAFWFHPLTWAARRFLALETESACDEMVLGSTRITPQSYGALLLNTMNTPQTPLTAGVADGFFALKTRLLRLNQAPKRPHRAWQVAFVAALCLAFGALVPLRFVARAQNVAPVSAAPNAVAGTVVDQNEKLVAGATVYALRSHRNGDEPLETTLSDAKGQFRFSSKVREGVELLADAGARGLGHIAYYNTSGDSQPLEISVAPSARATLRFVDGSNRPVVGLPVQLWRVGPSPNLWMALPKTMLRSLRATTDARGMARFGPLPAGMLAQFWFTDKGKTSREQGPGARFAALTGEDVVVLSAPRTFKTIRLLPKATIEARVTFPDGRPAQGVSFSVRRIVRGEAAQFSRGLDASAQTGPRGVATLGGLRAGLYSVWVDPSKELARDWGPIFLQMPMRAGLNRLKFSLSGGALIQGVVLSQATGQPVKGQTMGLHEGQANTTQNMQYTITDARGYFRFHAQGGRQHLWVHANGINSPPPGFILPVKSEFDFSIKNGQKRDFRIEMPRAPVIKPTTGTVLGPDGNALAGATVLYHVIGGRSYVLHRVKTNASGHFSLPLKWWSARPIQLWAEAGELVTPHGLVALGGEAVTLRLEANASASAEGRITDEKKQPLSGVTVHLYSLVGNVGMPTREAKSDADGRCRFEHLQPGMSVMLNAGLNGYDSAGAFLHSLERGHNQTFNIVMRRAAATLSGRVVGEDGKPVRGYQVSASGSNRTVLTRSDGRFFAPQVLSGPILVDVYTPQGGMRWGWYSARGGDKNMLIRLSKAKRQDRFTRAEIAKTGVKPASLTGKMAPEIRAARWANDKAAPLASLRGQVVLLAFDRFNFNPNSEVIDFARSFEGRVQVVGIQPNFSSRPSAKTRSNPDKATPQMTFPLALDAPLPRPRSSGGLTYEAYGNAQYAVIGRDGRIVYAGDELDRAITFAASAAR